MKKFKRADIKKICVDRAINIPIKKLQMLRGDIVVDIVNRTLAGKDRNNKAFKPYSRQYAEWKKEKYGVTRPNLFNDGLMLGALISEKISKGITLYLSGKDEKQKALSNIKKGRDFMGIDKALKNFIQKTIFK